MAEAWLDRAAYREGSRQFDHFRIVWHARYDSGQWTVDCALWQGEIRTDCTLTDADRVQPFRLTGAGPDIEGVLSLIRDRHATGDRLMLDWHDGELPAAAQTLCRWQVCDPCSTAPEWHGSGSLDTPEPVAVSWCIAGAAQAALEAEVTLQGYDHPIFLGPRRPLWQGPLRQTGQEVAVTLQLQIGDQGDARIEAVTRAGSEQVLLDHLVAGPGPGPGPDPLPQDGRQHRGISLEGTRTLASLVLPCLRLPCPDEGLARRFVRLDNSGTFQAALRALPPAGKRAAMQAAAADYLAQPSSRWPGEFVADIASLTGPMARLGTEAARVLLTRPAERAEDLTDALARLLDEPPGALIASPEFAPQRTRLQDSLVALLLTDAACPHQLAQLDLALRGCHLVLALAGPDSRSLPPPALHALQQARPLLPAALTPPADTAPANGYAAALGLCDLRVIRQRLIRYRRGEVAHIENVMRGEAQDRSEEISHQSETRETDTQQIDHSASRTGLMQFDSAGSRVSENDTLAALKREFDNLKQAYGTDGLSVTVSGGWLDSGTAPASRARQVAEHARRLLDRATARVADRVACARNRRTVEAFVASRRRRFDNRQGNGPLIGVYRWVDAVHRIELIPDGSRLLVEIVLADPARDLVARTSALQGLDIRAPIPPWLGGDGLAPVTSPVAIGRDNHAALAARYRVAVPPPPLPQQVRSAVLRADPPQNLATIAIPAGHVVTGGSVAYGWRLPAAGDTPVLEVLLGDTVLRLDPAQDNASGSKPLPAMAPGIDAVPVTALSTGLDYVLHVTLDCHCPEDAPAFAQWQLEAYRLIMAGYAARRDDYLASMAGLAEQAAHASPEAPADLAAAECTGAAIRCLMAPALQQLPAGTPGGRQDSAVLALTRFFRDALAWRDSVCSYYPDYFAADAVQRPRRMVLDRAPDAPADLTAFLEAGCARLLVPVRPAYALALLYYLGSGGLFWRGDDTRVPVCETDIDLADQIRALTHGPRPEAGTETWDITLPTALLMLQEDGGLPCPDAEQETRS